MHGQDTETWHENGQNVTWATFLSLRIRPKSPKRYAGSVFDVAETPEEAQTLRWPRFRRCGGAPSSPNVTLEPFSRLRRPPKSQTLCWYLKKPDRILCFRGTPIPWAEILRCALPPWFIFDHSRVRSLGPSTAPSFQPRLFSKSYAQGRIGPLRSDLMLYIKKMKNTVQARTVRGEP